MKYIPPEDYAVTLLKLTYDIRNKLSVIKIVGSLTMPKYHVMNNSLYGPIINTLLKQTFANRGITLADYNNT